MASERPDAALKKGDLKFSLDGYKLKGSWVLVRTKGPERAQRVEWSLGRGALAQCLDHRCREHRTDPDDRVPLGGCDVGRAPVPP